MKNGSACAAMRAHRDRCTVWRSLGGYLLLEDDRYRIGYDPAPDDLRRPCLDPLPDAVAREAIAAGMPVRRGNDLFAVAA